MKVKCENCGRPTHVLRESRLVICHIACTVEEALSSPLSISDFVDELFEQKKHDMQEFITVLRREMGQRLDP